MSTQRRLMASGGTVAIYDVESTAPDDGPFNSPLAYVGRLHFHSALPSLCVIPINGVYAHTGSFTAPAVSQDTFSNAVHTVIASHGLGSTPIVFGKITISGVTSPFLGTVPLTFRTQTASSPGLLGFGHWAHLGADGSSVFIRTFSVAGTGSGTLPAFTASYTVYVTNTLLDGTTAIYPGDTVPLRITGSLFTAGYGRLDSRSRYLKSDSSSPTTKIASGRTMDVVADTSTSKNSPFVRVLHSVDGYTNGFGVSYPTFSSFAATVQGVKF